MESPVNPLLYVLGYGAEFVAQGTPADMNGLAKVIEEGIRFPGFAFINVQSPCVTYGLEDQQLKAQKATMQTLESLGHDPADVLAAMGLAQALRREAVHGRVLPQPGAGARRSRALARERQESHGAPPRPRHAVLDVFKLAK